MGGAERQEIAAMEEPRPILYGVPAGSYLKRFPVPPARLFRNLEARREVNVLDNEREHDAS